MRPVRIPPGSTPPKEWLEEAEALTEQLKGAADDKARIALVWANRKLWRDKRLLKWLTDLHHRKCWYSEARESVSSYHVDHFRPKGRAAQLDGVQRAGYWWLTFDWMNYRLSGQLLNVKKRDLFPVQLPGVANPAIPHTLDIEASLLIDPLKQEAWLISFERTEDEQCLACPCPGVEGDELGRVNITIDVLGLNRLDALNQNRAAIWDQCMAWIQEYRAAHDEAVLHTRNARCLISARELASLSSEEAEFSSVAKACIAKHAPKVLQLQVEDFLLHPELLRTVA
ncbi:hypothetical protein [Pseudomonas aeruginosa]|uniref:hypothetical protein n=1 Tax=Pseudomonas aeruginosa TaxID=287 RepID=UPI001AEDA11A|nr:hypothetical protein [Pseudomonas aeruginosa]QTQ95611.1 hypothetical protein J9247_18030 [Pseudomonas aeruginosa]